MLQIINEPSYRSHTTWTLILFCCPKTDDAWTKSSPSPSKENEQLCQKPMKSREKSIYNPDIMSGIKMASD